jgi:hypothetical protein
MNTVRTLKSAFLCLALCASFSKGSSRQCLQSEATPLLKSSDFNSACIPIQDDKRLATTEAWDVWENTPHCFYPKNETFTKHCIYTYISSDGEGGLSFFTTPETAALSAGIVRSVDKPWDHSNSFHLSFDRPASFEIETIQGKGKGIIAKRDIRKDEVIVTELPYLVIRSGLSKFMSSEERVQWIQQALGQLPLSHEARIRKLARSNGGHAIEDIFRTNSFGIDVDGFDHSAIYPIISVRVRSLFRRVQSVNITLKKKENKS